jgi:hypothetical protein
MPLAAPIVGPLSGQVSGDPAWRGPDMIGRIRRRPLLAVIVAIVAELAALPLKLALNTVAGGDVGLLVPMAVVVVMAWFGGLAAGFAATLVVHAAPVLGRGRPNLEVARARSWPLRQVP